MTIELGYDEVRKIAKAFSVRTNREIKHTDILNDIAGAIGLRGDAMMHALKTADPGKQKNSTLQTIGSATSTRSTSGVFTRSEFMAELVSHFDISDDPDALLAVVHLGSYDPDNPDASQHLDLFAQAIAPKPLSQTIVGYDGEGNFLVAWPYVWLSGDSESKVKKMLSDLDVRLGRVLASSDAKQIVPHAYAVGAVCLETTSRFDEARIEKAITRCRDSAKNQWAVRAEYPYFPMAKFVF